MSSDTNELDLKIRAFIDYALFTDVEKAVQEFSQLIATKEAEAYKKGWAKRGDYELKKYENDKG